MMPGYDCYGIAIEDQVLGSMTKGSQLPVTLKEEEKDSDAAISDRQILK